MESATFLAFAECFSEAILLLDRQGRLLAANRAGRDLLPSLEKSGAGDYALSDFVSDPDNKLETYLSACAASEAPLTGLVKLRRNDISLQVICQGRGVMPAQTSTSHQLGSPPADNIILRCLPETDQAIDAQALNTALVQLTAEVEHRRQLEQRLQQRDREARQHRERLVHVARLSTMGEMAAGIAHEINQPLTAIATYASASNRLLRSGLSERQELLNTLEKISLQARRAGEIIQRLRGFVKKQESQRETFDLNRLVADTMVLAETDARLHAFVIEMILHEQPLQVSVDSVQIQQVLLNLIRNGMDAMLEANRTDGYLCISTRRVDSDFAVVAVRDQGVGITDEQNDKLFSPFFTTKANGIGLGLSISRSIINAHGGRLKFERNTNEPGVTMYFTLPLEVGNADG